MYIFCIYAEILHKYAILGGGVLVLLNKHFLTKVLTLNTCILKKFVFW